MYVVCGFLAGSQREIPLESPLGYSDPTTTSRSLPNIQLVDVLHNMGQFYNCIVIREPFYLSVSGINLL